MKKFLIAVLGFMTVAFYNAAAQSSYDESVESYIQFYRNVAIEEMQRTGIPASITLAQGIIESNAGMSPLATDANNHFGIKCHAGWTGPSYTYDDDRKNECFRKYDTPYDSYKDHSDFLKTRQRYAVLFTYDPMNYKAWAKGLKSCGYATNPRYAEILIKCIEDYDLHQWDLKEEDRGPWFAQMNKSMPVPKTDTATSVLPADAGSVLTVVSAEERIFRFNDIKCVTLQEGESLNDLATAYEIGMKRFMRYNDITDPSQLHTGDRVYLQPKRRNGDTPYHTVLQGETMFSIARDHGIQLSALYEKNLMVLGTQPAEGEVMYLKETRKELPKLAGQSDPAKQEMKPAPVPAATITSPSAYYVVAGGDTLYSISKKYNLTVSELKALNKKNSDRVYIGEKLKVEKK